MTSRKNCTGPGIKSYNSKWLTSLFTGAEYNGSNMQRRLDIMGSFYSVYSSIMHRLQISDSMRFLSLGGFVQHNRETIVALRPTTISANLGNFNNIHMLLLARAFEIAIKPWQLESHSLTNLYNRVSTRALCLYQPIPRPVLQLISILLP